MPQTLLAEEPAEQVEDAVSFLPIRTVANLTGINPVTLRAWERRYSLITPRRTPKGHRLYTNDDVELIKQVLDLLDQGISISQVKPLLEQPPGQQKATALKDTGDVWKNYQQKMLDAVEKFDEQVLDSIYNDALSLYPIDVLNQRLVLPLLRIIGERWKEREAAIAEEHFFSVYLRNKIGSRIHHLNQRSSSSEPLLMLACLPGEYHEIGLLLFALTTVNFGYRVLILGSNTPLEQLPKVLQQKSCAAIVLSGSARPTRGLFDGELSKLVKNSDVPVFIGGNIAAKHQQKIEAAGAICLGESFSAGLRAISQLLKSVK
ncbi:MAG: MerR family transcriptional regulator [Gammaproteobacteria bacterium]|nr:MerR family transcriptional regulator [Gammaproteobacteria bacterium]